MKPTSKRDSDASLSLVNRWKPLAAQAYDWSTAPAGQRHAVIVGCGVGPHANLPGAIARRSDDDIQILMSVGKLTPLGDPAANAPKWFAAVEMIQLATDQAWLHKATKEISKYWQNKRERRGNSSVVKC